MSERRFVYDDATGTYLDTKKPLSPVYQTASVGSLVAAYENLEDRFVRANAEINSLITAIGDIQRNNGVWTSNDRGGGTVFNVDLFCSNTLGAHPRPE